MPLGQGVRGSADLGAPGGASIVERGCLLSFLFCFLEGGQCPIYYLPCFEHQHASLTVSQISIVLSLAWILHIFLHNLVHLYPFLNALFIEMDNAFPLLGIIAYGCFTYYLLWAVVKGVTKVCGSESES